MKNLNPLIFLFVILLQLTGCKKDKDAEPTKEQQISGKDWRASSVMATTSLSPTTPIEAITYLPTCQTDNILRFETNGQVTNDEGPTKCLLNAPQTMQGNYSISGDILTIDGPILNSFGVGFTTAKNLTIDELTNETLKLTLNETVTLPGAPIPINTLTITFTPQ